VFGVQRWDIIRQELGFPRFLIPPSIDELQQCAVEGVIVFLSVTDVGADAIIVSKFAVTSLALPDMYSNRLKSF